jgi:hypothetical protein
MCSSASSSSKVAVNAVVRRWRRLTGVDRVYGDDGYPTLILGRADELEDVLCAASRRAA